MTSLDPARLHGSGPWLVVATSARGISKEVLDAIRRQCDDSGVTCHVIGIDERPERLFLYKGLILIFPFQAQADDDSEDSPEVEQLLALMTKYREDYKDGAVALFPPNPAHAAAWYEVGIVQIVAPTAKLNYGAVRDALRLRHACVAHSVDGEVGIENLDVFSIYKQSGNVLSQTPSQAEEDLREGWEYLESCKIPQSLDAVNQALEIIEGWIKRYDDPQYGYKAVPGSALSRLQWVLKDPETRKPTPELREFLASGPDERKQWAENGANAVRDVKADLKKVFPDLKRPGKREGKKGAARDFAHLVRMLRTIKALAPAEKRAGLSGSEAVTVRE